MEAQSPIFLVFKAHAGFCLPYLDARTKAKKQSSFLSLSVVGLSIFLSVVLT